MSVMYMTDWDQVAQTDTDRLGPTCVSPVELDGVGPIDSGAW